MKLDYAEMINVIANTCLLFCDRKSMGDHIDYKMEENNASSMTPFRQRSTFCELANEVSLWYDKEVDLETLLHDYKDASNLYSDFKRSYSIDLHNTVAEEKRLQIIHIINFLNPVVDNDSEIVFLNDDKKQILYDSKEESTQFQAIFILLMVGLIPTYSSKKGSASHIIEDFHLLMDFLRKYGEQAPSADIIKGSPILTGFETWLNDNDESEVRRIDLINMTRRFLETSFGYSSAENTFLLNQQINRLYPDIDGFWSDSQTPGSHFWKFEKIVNGYNLYEFNLKRENRSLEYTKYECYIYGEDTDNASFFICHPSMMRKLVNHENTDFFKEWTDATVTKNEDGVINKMSFHPTIRMNAPILPRTMYRIEDSGLYQNTLDNSQLNQINLFHDDDYTFYLNRYAITIEYLYVILDEDDINQLSIPNASHTMYLKIPKSLNPSLDLLTLNDEWGICNFNNGNNYFFVSNSLLFFKINSESERKKYGIEITDKIE